MIFFVIHFSGYDGVSRLWLFMAFDSGPEISSSVLFDSRPIESCLSVLCAVNPRRCFDILLLDAMLEHCLEPKTQPVCLRGS
jgi:hypothetical protein